MKKWIISVLCVTLCCLLLVGSVNFLVDPLMYYRSLHPALSFVAFDYDYINPGLAKNSDYTAVLVGTSLTENTDMDYCEGLFHQKMVKLIYPGGTAKNNHTILDVAFRTHCVNRVLWTIDDSLFFSAADELSHELPTYLYDTNKLNDISYLLNFSILYNYSFKSALGSLRGMKNTPLLRGDVWGADEQYGYDQVMAKTSFSPADAKPVDFYQENITGNLNAHIIPIITEHPQTQFDFYFPPKCIAYWGAAESNGVLDAKFFSMNEIVKTLLAYPNVRIYFYMDKMDWTDFDLYRDSIHFNQEINNRIMDEIAASHGELTFDNYARVLENCHRLYKEMDYSQIIHQTVDKGARAQTECK